MNDISYVAAEKFYDSLDDDAKRLAGILGVIQSSRFSFVLFKKIARISSGKADDNK